MAGHCSGAPVLKHLAANRGACVTLDELESALPMKRQHISSLMFRLITDKYVVRRERGCFQVTAAGIAADAKGYKPGPQREKRAEKRKPNKSSMAQRVWKTLRLRRRATIPEIVANAARGDELDAAASVQRYLHRLSRAGYVKKLKVKVPGTAPNSRGFAVWLLLKDTGPIAPGFYSLKQELVDHNTGERVAIGGAQ